MNSEINKFFSQKNTVNKLTDEERLQTADYLAPIRAFARATYKSIYVIDYMTRGFEYVSDNPLFLCGHTPEEVQEMGYSFYFKYVPPEDLEMLMKMNKAAFEYYDTFPIEERMLYTVSYDFHLLQQDGRSILINQKLTPIFLTETGKMWKAVCIISLSNAQESGNIKGFKHGYDTVLKYDLESNVWKEEEKLTLTEREKEILHYSIKGYKNDEIAKLIFKSLDTVKSNRRNLFDKLGVNNMTEAIAYVINNKML